MWVERKIKQKKFRPVNLLPPHPHSPRGLRFEATTPKGVRREQKSAQMKMFLVMVYFVSVRITKTKDEKKKYEKYLFWFFHIPEVKQTAFRICCFFLSRPNAQRVVKYRVTVYHHAIVWQHKIASNPHQNRTGLYMNFRVVKYLTYH